MKNIIPYNMFEMAKYDNNYIYEGLKKIINKIKIDRRNNSINIADLEYNNVSFTYFDPADFDTDFNFDQEIYLVRIFINFDNKSEFRSTDFLRIKIIYDDDFAQNNFYYSGEYTKNRFIEFENIKKLYLNDLYKTDKIVNDFYDFCNDCVKEALKIK
jgi:hypothetical protein